jgi:DivIVA domain-containing protein
MVPMALAFEILLAAAVLLGVALAAAGRVDGMSRAVPDAPPGLPPGPVTADGLRTVRLPVVLRGYRMADVDELLERAASQLEDARASKTTQSRTESPPELATESQAPQEAEVDG